MSCNSVLSPGCCSPMCHKCPRHPGCPHLASVNVYSYLSSHSLASGAHANLCPPSHFSPSWASPSSCSVLCLLREGISGTEQCQASPAEPEQALLRLGTGGITGSESPVFSPTCNCFSFPSFSFDVSFFSS